MLPCGVAGLQEGLERNGKGSQVIHAKVTEAISGTDSRSGKVHCPHQKYS